MVYFDGSIMFNIFSCDAGCRKNGKIVASSRASAGGGFKAISPGGTPKLGGDTPKLGG